MLLKGFDQLPKPPDEFHVNSEKTEQGSAILMTYREKIRKPKKLLFICISYMLHDLAIFGYTNRDLWQTLHRDEPCLSADTFEAAYAYMYDIATTGGETIRRLGLKLE